MLSCLVLPNGILIKLIRSFAGPVKKRKPVTSPLVLVFVYNPRKFMLNKYMCFCVELRRTVEHFH